MILTLSVRDAHAEDFMAIDKLLLPMQKALAPCILSLHALCVCVCLCVYVVVVVVVEVVVVVVVVESVIATNSSRSHHAIQACPPLPPPIVDL